MNACGYWYIYYGTQLAGIMTNPLLHLFEKKAETGKKTTQTTTINESDGDNGEKMSNSDR